MLTNRIYCGNGTVLLSAVPKRVGPITCDWASLVAQRLKRLPIMQETWVRSLGQEDAMENEMASQFSILAWKVPWTEVP